MHHLGLTRSALHHDHLLHTPDAFVRTPLPGLERGMAVVHVSPQAGARFTMTTVELEAGGVLREGPAQRFVYVLGGELTLSTATGGHALGASSFAYLPGGVAHRLEARTAALVVLIEKPYQPLPGAEAPALIVGCEAEIAGVPLDGDPGVRVRAMLPASMAHDFACNTMEYAPGASLRQVEMHYMEHGLLMIGGGGVYRLSGQWYPVEDGDAIWMAPYCPQWFAAVGKEPAKYLIYKDFWRHPQA